MGAMIRMAMADGAEISVYHAPAVGHRTGGLVLVQEIFGVTDHIRELCDEYAEDGYEVLAPSLYDREHPGFEAEYTGEDLERSMTLAKTHPFEQSLSDVQTCINRLGADGPVFVTGYCYGGSVAWYAATTLEGVAAASGYYGRLAAERAIDQEPKVPVQMHFGRFDASIPMELVEALEAKHYPKAEIFIYEAGHGFNSDRRKDYHELSADLAKERTLALFGKYGV